MTDKVVQLIRRFRPMTHLGEWAFLFPDTSSRVQRWHEMESSYRVLILADPGAGKTFEALDRANKYHEAGRKAFFIRIERIDANFAEAFEVGTATDFETWLSSSEEGWFFLDSVDEAQLETPRALERAIQVFGDRIYGALERAHIFITSREDAWEGLSDRTLIKEHLPHSTLQDDGSDDKAPRRGDDGLVAFRLAGLSLNEIKLFAIQYGVSDVNAFVSAIDHGNLMPLAERPFDLKALTKKWNADGYLGSRFDVLTRLVDLQVAPLATAKTGPRISMERGRDGVRNLAAAAMLTGKSIIRLPEGVLTADRIDPATVLSGWSDAEIGALLRTGIFDDIVYGSVRFRHREIRELLAAQWAADQLQNPSALNSVQDLFFRSIYDVTVIIPRMRPALTWMILLDDAIRDRALTLEPDLATEGGDPSRLPQPVRQAMLANIVARIAQESE
ncbi:hypothetical protein [Asticcacaulis sp.]|uniref:hypothetical protein n=1 Tax=Asticcacaulis sp. TaxID=1872648 RepID=UPI002D150E05|nr:hypothetical protein [Asticcacaulis sp.]HTM82167.1 hypothetical protein [Asticcacaulis sp.]